MSSDCLGNVSLLPAHGDFAAQEPVCCNYAEMFGLHSVPGPSKGTWRINQSMWACFSKWIKTHYTLKFGCFLETRKQPYNGFFGIQRREGNDKNGLSISARGKAKRGQRGFEGQGGLSRLKTMDLFWQIEVVLFDGTSWTIGLILLLMLFGLEFGISLWIKKLAWIWSPRLNFIWSKMQFIETS